MIAENEIDAQIPRTLRRKIRRDARLVPASGFPQMGANHYLTWLSELHISNKPNVYLEIGTESGASLSFASCTSIAVDPKFALETDVSRNKPQMHQFQCTSDDFFASGFLDKMGLKVDVAFLDGMHLFEFLLRDFMNLERYMAPEGIIVIHNCVPFNFPSAERTWNKKRTRSWTGDIWKLIPILRKYRTDIDLNVYDLRPSGLVVAGNLNPENTILPDCYERIIEEYGQYTLKSYGLEELNEIIDLKPAPVFISENSETLKSPTVSRAISRWEAPPISNTDSLRIAIKTPKARIGNEAKIVDFPFARALGDGFLKAGHSVRIDPGLDWYKDTDGTDFDLVLRGRGGFIGQQDIPHINWVLYPGMKPRHQISDDEISSALHTFFASGIVSKRISQRMPTASVSTLFQGFDPRLMFSDSEQTRSGIVFVGSNHFKHLEERVIVELARKSNTNIRLWGSGWKTHPMANFLESSALDFNKLGDTYRAAEIVLCDHMPSMRNEGYISNRIFDALACGTPVISDRIDGIPDDLRPFVSMCETPDEFRSAIIAVENENTTIVESRRLLSLRMQSEHSLHSRAARIVELFQQLSGREVAF